MTLSASAKKEIAQDPMGRCVRTRVKSAEVASDACYWAINDFKEGGDGKFDLDNVGCTCYFCKDLARDGHEQVHMGNVGCKLFTHELFACV